MARKVSLQKRIEMYERLRIFNEGKKVEGLPYECLPDWVTRQIPIPFVNDCCSGVSLEEPETTRPLQDSVRTESPLSSEPCSEEVLELLKVVGQSIGCGSLKVKSSSKH